MLRSDLCDFSDAYIVAKGNITVTKKAFTADDIDPPNNTASNVNATNAIEKQQVVYGIIIEINQIVL